MSISPPSDILLDIARAADPARARAAIDKLAGEGGDSSGFMQALEGEANQPASKSPSSPLASASFGPLSKVPDKLSPYAQLEAFVLQQFVESILPKENSFFGKGYSGGIWRSMMAEHMARNIVKAGGIGLAKQLEQGHANRSGDPAA